MNLDRDELFRLFGALRHDTLAASGQQRLQETLRASAAARRLWFVFNDIELGLSGQAAQPPASAPVPARAAAALWRTGRWWGAAAAAAAAVLLATLAILPGRARVPVAVLNAATNARWADPNVELMLRGGELPAGPLRLEAGVVEFIFAGGATAVIEGPSVFEPVAANRLVLRSGRVIGRCNKVTTKLIVVTPNATVTDLGTEFGVAVGGNQETHVAVIKGAVDLVAGRHPQRLTAGQAASVNQQGTLEKADFSMEDFSKLATILPAEELPVIDGVNRLSDPQISAFSQHWQFTEGHVDRHATGAARIRAQGSPLWPLLWQTVPTGDIAGRTIIASVRAMQPADDPLSGRQNAIVKIVFVDASGQEFASAQRHFLRADAPHDRWLRGQIAALAPPGAAGVKFQALLNARGLRTGSVVFADAGLFIGDAAQ